MAGADYYRAKEFAQRAGVTVRTLHVYDRLGLLPPAKRAENGYRLYGQAELERLEQIVALRFVGFTLQEIKELLNAQPLPLTVALRMQREILRQRRDKLDRTLRALDRAEAAVGAGGEPDLWDALRAIIEVMNMEQSDWEWAKHYYSPDAQQKIAQRAAAISKEELEKGRRAWVELIADVEAAAKHEDPAGERARELVARWKSLVNEFTGGDPGIREGLNKLYADPQHWPKDFKRPWSDEADRFIHAAMKC